MRTSATPATVTISPVPVSGGSTAQIGGASIADLGPVLAEQVGLPPAARGIVVTDVDPSSPAGVAGLLPGDVILGINNTSVQTVTELQDAVWRMALTPVVLYVGRGGAVYSFTVATR